MSSQKQIDANRLNAQKSTGPKTPEGRAAVRLNGLSHGLTAQTLVLAGESQPDFESLIASLEAEHQPASATEVALVSQLAMATWRLRRGYHAEASFLTKRIVDTRDRAEGYKDVTASDRVAIAIDYSSQTLNNFSRFESRLERSFFKAFKELQRLHAQRPAEMENQSQFQDCMPDPVPTDPSPAELPRAASQPKAAERDVPLRPGL